MSTNNPRGLKDVWNMRMGHIHHGSLKFICEIVIGVSEVKTKHDDVCKDVLGKFSK